MKKRLTGLLIILMITALAFGMSACGGKDDETEPAEGTGTETTTDDGPAIAKSIADIDTEDMQEEPLQIESITLYDDGTVAIVPTEDLKKNAEDNDELKDGAVYPFADSGKIKDIYVVHYGNGGYRTIIALTEEGTLSAVSARELIEDHIFVTYDNLSGRDNYVSVEEKQGEDAYYVVGVTEDGEEVELDSILSF